MMTTTNYDEKRIHANAATVAAATTRTNAGARATAKNANGATVAITDFIGLPGITEDTTLNELIALARNNAVEKPNS